MKLASKILLTAVAPFMIWLVLFSLKNRRSLHHQAMGFFGKKNGTESVKSYTEPPVHENKWVDSHLTLETALHGSSAPGFIRKDLVLVSVRYRGYDSLEHQGQLVLHRGLRDEIVEIFEELFLAGFPIEKVKPIIHYKWSDSASMADNNTSAFNYRKSTASNRLSLHAYGRAIDINPRQNPYIYREIILPEGGTFEPSAPGTITETSQIVRLFEEKGWRWGGRWKRPKDFQHFEK